MQPHNFTAQYTDTKIAFENLDQGQIEGQKVQLELRFLPANGDAEWGGLAASLQKSGYEVDIADEPQMIRAQTCASDPALDEIWWHEQRMTQIALSNDFAPTGWRVIKSARQTGKNGVWADGTILQGWRASPSR